MNRLKILLTFQAAMLIAYSHAQGTLTGQNLNYKVRNEILVPGIINESSIPTLIIDQSRQLVEYMNDGGRTVQVVSVQGSPARKDIVTDAVYDNLGRESVRYLPMVSTAADGRYKPGLLTGPTSAYVNSAHYNFYHGADPSMPTDNSPFSVSYFENSPQGRLIEQASVGAIWQKDVANPQESKTATLSYGTNSANEIRLWTVTGSTIASTLTSTYYPSGVLFSKTVTQAVTEGPNANDNEYAVSVEFTDREGKLVMKKVKTEPVANTWAETYYVYDVYSNLRFILSPELNKAVNTQGLTTLISDQGASLVLSANTTLTGTNSNSYAYLPSVVVSLTPSFNGLHGFEIRASNGTGTLLSAYAYQYIYDNENRKIGEKAPGRDWVYFVYDKRDRLVLIQDGNQRQQNQWTFTKYDSWNRPVLSGIVTLAATVDQVRLDVLADPDVFETTGGTIHGYTNNCYPNVTDPNAYLVASYYDDYNFKSQIGNSAYNYKNDELAGLPVTENLRMTGLATGSKIKILNQTNWLWSVSYYDDRQRLIQTISANHKSGTDRISSRYDFAGKPLVAKTSHSTSIASQSFTEEYIYDHSGRLLKTLHQIGSQPKIILANLAYNELGGPKKKLVHSIDNGSNYLLTQDFTNTIKGQVNSTDSNWGLGLGGGGGNGSFFTFLEYETANTRPRYDGLLSTFTWFDDWSVSNEPSYSFDYDNRGQLRAATYSNRLTPTKNNLLNENNITYDLNGNIKTLNRNSGGLVAQPIDQLTYQYGTVGNQLTRVTDALAGTVGFNDQNKVGDDYTYDLNGNLTTDKNKLITLITYNFLNKPDRINFSDGSYIQYAYDAGGQKLTQSYFNVGAQVTMTTDYVAGFVYVDNQLQHAFHSEGRMTPSPNENLIVNGAANTIAGFQTGLPTTITSQVAQGPLGPESYLKFVATSTIPNPINEAFSGLRNIGNSQSGTTPFTVVPGETYLFRVVGYQSVGSTAKLFMTADYTPDPIKTLIGPALPIGQANEGWVQMQYSVPAGVTELYIGVAWDGRTAGDTFFINHVSLYKSDWEYQYYINDHVGSTRAVLQTSPSITSYTATMESENNVIENSVFKNVSAAQIVVNAAANATVGGDEAIVLNSNYRVGPAKSLKVYTGDNIKLSVSAFYGSPLSNGQLAGVPIMSAALASALMVNTTQAIVDGINLAYTNSVPGTNPLFALGQTQGSTNPSAFLNYILFDENYVPINARSIPIGSTPGVKQLLLNGILIKQVGYLFTYLSYDNLNTGYDVFFDEFKVSHEESSLIQVNGYYPFGMTSYSWTREGETENRYLYQGKELDTNSGLHDFGARQYDAALGRWFATDPEAQFASPYLGMGNSPINGTDPDGRFFGLDDAVVAAVGFAYGYISYGIQNDDWGGKALANGAINAALFELGYLTAGGGLGATGTFMGGFGGAGSFNAAGSFLASSAVSIAASPLLPSIPIYQDKNFSLSASPTFSLQGFGAGLNASYTTADGFSLGGGVGITRSFGGGFESRIGGGLSYFDGTSGGSLGLTHFGGTYPQNNWIAGYRNRDVTIRTANDVGVGGDKWRTAALEIGFREYSFGFNVFTTPPAPTTERNNLPSKIWGENANNQGTYVNGNRVYSGLYLGYTQRGVTYRGGVDAPFVQDFTQNGWHKFINTHLNSNSAYFNSGYGAGWQPYFFQRTYDPYSLF